MRVSNKQLVNINLVIDTSTINLSDSAYVPCTTVFVATSQNQFEGYMLEARETTTSGDFEETSTIWGEWQVGPSDLYHTVDCNRNKDSAETVVVRTSCIDK